jgi:hypothetical protein
MMVALYLLSKIYKWRDQLIMSFIIFESHLLKHAANILGFSIKNFMGIKQKARSKVNKSVIST